jgi:Tol biopolymer transport system component
VAASADGRRLVASVANSTAAGLSSVPILDGGVADEPDVKPYPLQTGRASAPRFGKGALFYLSSTGGEDGLWRDQDGKPAEIWKGSDGALLGAAAVSPTGDRVAVVLSRQGKRILTRLSIDGGDRQPLAPDIDIRGNPSWSPDGKWILSGGNDAQGPALFMIPVDGSKPLRVVPGPAFDPVMSPVDNVIVYAGPQLASAPLLAVRTDASPVVLPKIRVLSAGGGRWRFLSDGRLVYMQGPAGAQDFWVLDLVTQKYRRLTQLSNPATTTTFDITPDGKHIVFDRVRERSDIVLIDLPK